MFHVSSLLSKYAEYSEAELTRQMSQLLSSKANLTEALGVSAELGGMIQAWSEELMDSKVLELDSGITGVGILVIGILVVVTVGFFGLQACIACNRAWEYHFDEKRVRERAREKNKRIQEKKSRRHAAAQKFYMKKLWEMKFGKGSGDDVQLCLDQLSSKGASLIKAAGQNPYQLRQLLLRSEFNGIKVSPRQQVKMLRTVFTAFMAHHGATIAERGLDQLGVGSCGKVFCAGDLNFALDESGLYRCDWQCPASYLPDSFDALETSMKTTFAGLVNSHSDLVEELGKKDTYDSTIKKSELRRMTKAIKIKNMKYYASDPWSPESLKILKMPNASTFLPLKHFGSMYYKGTCIPERKYFKKHDVAIVTSSTTKLPKGTVVKLDRVVTSGEDSGAWFTQGKVQKKLWLPDLSFGLIPVRMDAWGSLTATNRSHPFVQDPVDHRKMYYVQP